MKIELTDKEMVLINAYRQAKADIEVFLRDFWAFRAIDAYHQCNKQQNTFEHTVQYQEPAYRVKLIAEVTELPTKNIVH
ncbi:MAG: hypothetical protein IJ187_00470 [Neisseriaceae bacterium]|nr:hypothetical protein [Neisseriaceae bacterium]